MSETSKVLDCDIKVSRDINDLIKIMAALRDPKTGCPWDMEQTCETIIPYTIEEVYEVIDAIKRDDPVELCDELGDLLFQVIYYAQICSEQNLFSFGDVVEAITAKMIRRHPHVFGSAKERSQGMKEGQWQRIKQQEKEMRQLKKTTYHHADNKQKSLLSEVATVFPAPIEAIKLQNKAASVGFDWSGSADVLDKLKEETMEIAEAIENGVFSDIEAELGDIYFTIINLARKLNVDPEKALSRTNKKFRQRFNHIEVKVAEVGGDIKNYSLEQLEAYWREAKTS